MVFSSPQVIDFINRSLQEDVGSGDHSSLASIPSGKQGKARLIFKEDGKVTSIAKICLSCYKNHIVTEKNTFINSEIDYEKIHQLLDNLASH